MAGLATRGSSRGRCRRPATAEGRACRREAGRVGGRDAYSAGRETVRGPRVLEGRRDSVVTVALGEHLARARRVGGDVVVRLPPRDLESTCAALQHRREQDDRSARPPLTQRAHEQLDLIRARVKVRVRVRVKVRVRVRVKVRVRVRVKVRVRVRIRLRVRVGIG